MLIRFALYLMTCMAVRLAVFLIEDMVLKIELYDVNVALLSRSTITNGLNLFGGIEIFACVLTIAPWTCLNIARIVLKYQFEFHWHCVSFLYALICCCWLSAMDSVIGIPAPLANIPHDNLGKIYVISFLLFCTAEVVEFRRNNEKLGQCGMPRE